MSYVLNFCRLAVLTVAVCLLPAIVHAGVVPIRVDSSLPDPRPNAPVTFGVPFPRNTLPNDALESVRIVDQNDTVIAHQQAVTATWDAQGKQGVRWLLIDMLANPGDVYRLVFGDDAKPFPAAALSDIASERAGKIMIGAGAISGHIAPGRFEPFTTLESLGYPLAQPVDDLLFDEPKQNRFNAFYVEHETRGIFRSDLDKQATIRLEETGPIRATIKADGWYTNLAGERFCRYSIRMSFYRDSPDIKVEHTFIYTGRSQEDKIRNMGICFVRSEEEAGKKLRLYTGDADLAAGTAAADATGFMHVVQDSTERGRFDFYSLLADGKRLKWANQGGGWMTAGSGEWPFSVAIRDAWQQYPWAIKAHNGMVDVRLWPESAGLLDTTWDGYWSELTDHQKRFLASNMHHKQESVDDWLKQLRSKTNATGAAKTHEVWLSFGGPGYNRVPRGASPGAMGQLAREVDQPVIAYADPQWMCATEALDLQPHAARNEQLFGDTENTFDAMLTMMQRAVDANHWYGFWEWGAYHQHLSVGVQTPRYSLWEDDAGMNRWHRARPKSHYQWGRFPWVQYMRSGKRDWLRYAQTYTLYSADRAHSHHDGEGRHNGGEYHYDNSVVPWVGGYRFSPGGDQLASNLQGKDDYVFMYWLTGSRRAFDVLKANGELMIEHFESGGTWFNWKPGFTRGNDIRNAGMQLERLMALYQATWDPRYLKIAQHVADAFKPLTTIEQVRDAELNGSNFYFHQASTWAYLGMWYYYSITQDEAFRPALMAFIDRTKNYWAGFPGNGSTRALTYGYLLTKDPVYLELALANIDDFTARGMVRWQFNPGGKQELNPLPGVLGLTRIAPADWREQNLPLNEKRRSLTYRYYAYRESDYFKKAAAYFNEQTDQAWSFTIAANKGGRFVLYSPSNEPVAEFFLDGQVDNVKQVNVSSDGQTGSYKLVCEEPTDIIRNLRSTEHMPLARIVGNTLPMTFDALGSANAFPVMGRSLYVMADDKAASYKIRIGPVDPDRIIEVSLAGEDWSETTQGKPIHFGGFHVFTLPPTAKGKVVRIDFRQPADGAYDANMNWPRHISLTGFEPYVAGNREDLFVP